MNTDPLFVMMVITHQNNFGKSPSWLSVYKEYLEGFPWIKTQVIYGGDALTEEKKQTISEELQVNYHHVQSGDYYEHLPQKVIAGIKHIFSEWPTVKGIFKIDDDVEIVNMPKFIENAIMLISNGAQYAGITSSVSYTMSKHHLGKCQDPELNKSLPLNANTPYCGGPIYFLGQESIKVISTSTEYQINTIYEDNLIGYILYTYGNITPVTNSSYYNLDDMIKSSSQQLPTNSNELALDTNHNIEPQQTKLQTHNYKQITNQYAIRKKLFFLLHQNSISNYITVRGGLCNNLFQISATWHYGLLGQGNLIRCFDDGINNKQLTCEITNYYKKHIFPQNNYIPHRTDINYKPKYIDIQQSCFEYLGPIYDSNKIIINNGYFQHIQYINTFRLDTVWRHIINIDLMDELFLAHNSIDWQQRNNFFSVHIRQGDYLSLPNHFIDYSLQIARIIADLISKDTTNNIKFIFCTDDYELLKKNIHKYFPSNMNNNSSLDIEHFRYSIINESNPLKTLRLMAACTKGHILSNSSFSLWGAILNPNPEKEVYLPRKWLNSQEGADITESFKNISSNQVFFV